MAERPSFRAALIRRRCLAIADGFYNWREDAAGGGRPGEMKRPFLVRRVDRGPMGFAGLYETYCDATGGEIDTALIVTTPANPLLGGPRGRMPAILDPEDFAAWLDVDGVDVRQAAALLKPALESKLELIEVGPAVNRAANDDESLQHAIGEPIRSAAGAG